MFRRLRTSGLPGQPETSSTSYEWDFRKPDGDWVFILPMRSAGSPRARPRRPEQAAWLAERGLGEPDPRGRYALDTAQRAALIEALDPHSEIRWGAWEAYEASRALQLESRPHEAAAAAAQAVALAPGWDLPHRLLVELLLFGTEDLDAAREALAAAEGILPPREILQRHQALALAEGEDWTRYAQLQRRLIDEVQDRWDHWEVLGLAWWAAQDLERSIAAFEEGLKRNPGLRDLENRLAEVLHAAGRTPEALALLDRLIQEDPEHAKSWALRGWVRREAEPEAAAQDFAESLARDPEQAVARVGRGLLRLEAGDLPGARADLAPHQESSWSEGRAAWARYLEAGGAPEPAVHVHDHGHAHGHIANEPQGG